MLQFLKIQKLGKQINDVLLKYNRIFKNEDF